jgi:hypothetical protein
MLLRHYLAQGASKSALARQFVISRDRFTGGFDRASLEIGVELRVHTVGA